MGLLRHWLRRQVYQLYTEELLIREAGKWHVCLNPMCQGMLLAQIQFCPLCGTSQQERQTSAQFKILDTVVQTSTATTTTGIMKSYIAHGGERPIKTLHRKWDTHEPL